MEFEELKIRILAKVHKALQEIDINSHFGESAKNDTVESQLKDDIDSLMNQYQKEKE